MRLFFSSFQTGVHCAYQSIMMMVVGEILPLTRLLLKKMNDSSKSMAFRRLCISWIAICPNAHMLYTLKLRTSFWQIKCATENLWPASSSFNGWENSRIVTWACFSLLPQSQSGPLIVRDLDHEILAAAAAIHSTEPPQMAKSLT